MSIQRDRNHHLERHIITKYSFTRLYIAIVVETAAIIDIGKKHNVFIKKKFTLDDLQGVEFERSVVVTAHAGAFYF